MSELPQRGFRLSGNGLDYNILSHPLSLGLSGFLLNSHVGVAVGIGGRHLNQRVSGMEGGVRAEVGLDQGECHLSQVPGG